jgi:hypothetical protein
MNKQTIGNAIASLLFFIFAFVGYTHDNSGMGTVFLIFGAVYLGLTLSSRKK